MMHSRDLLIGALEVCIALLCLPTFSTAKTFDSTEEIPKFLRRELVAHFDKGQISVPDGEGFNEMAYRLSKPVIQPGQKYPLVLYLNGHAPRQMDYGNVGQLSHLDTLIYHYPS